MKDIGIGAIGCGGFGLFSLAQFSAIHGARLVAFVEPNQEAAAKATQKFNILKLPSVESLCAQPDVDLVYIATPPFLHYEHALMAANCGKHVVCEKPLAINLEQADELLDAANDHNTLMVANLLQRYNPLSDAVKSLIETKVMGELLHGFFENYASDESLGPQHWFWDKTKSGGIFVEHGVHFFDLFQAWLGSGEVVSAESCTRGDSEMVDQVQCCVRYRNQILVNFYHGFHQIGHMDRQELRLIFERGDVRLFGWVPTMMQIHAAVSEADQKQLLLQFPDARFEALEEFPPGERSCQGRHKSLHLHRRIRLTIGEESEKMSRYGQLVRALMEDQLQWISDSEHTRRITEFNGRESLRMAVAADTLAHLTHTTISG